MNPDLARKAGLIESGVTKYGEPMYLGTREQWEKYTELEELSEQDD